MNLENLEPHKHGWDVLIRPGLVDKPAIPLDWAYFDNSTGYERAMDMIAKLGVNDFWLKRYVFKPTPIFGVDRYKNSKIPYRLTGKWTLLPGYEFSDLLKPIKVDANYYYVGIWYRGFPSGVIEYYQLHENPYAYGINEAKGVLEIRRWGGDSKGRDCLTADVFKLRIQEVKR